MCVGFICMLQKFFICRLSFKITHWVGFEPTRGNPNWFLVSRLNHSAISAWKDICTTKFRLVFVHTSLREDTDRKHWRIDLNWRVKNPLVPPCFFVANPFLKSQIGFNHQYLQVLCVLNSCNIFSWHRLKNLRNGRELTHGKSRDKNVLCLRC